MVQVLLCGIVTRTGPRVYDIFPCQARIHRVVITPHPAQGYNPLPSSKKCRKPRVDAEFVNELSIICTFVYLNIFEVRVATLVKGFF